MDIQKRIEELTQQQAAERLGEDRATIANYMRLLELPEEIRDMLSGGRLSMGHARALLGLPERQAWLRLAERVITENMSVRRLEQLVRAEMQGAAKPASATATSAHIEELEREMTQNLGVRVRIRCRGAKRHRGSIVIDFASLDEFERVHKRLLGGQ